MLLFFALPASAACAVSSAAFFFAVVFFNFAKCAFIEPDLWPGFRAGLLPPVIFFGPGGSIPGSGSGGSPVDGPFGLTGVTKPISHSSCPSCNLVRMIMLIALFMLMSRPGAGMASLVSTWLL